MQQSKARDTLTFCLGIVLLGCLMQSGSALKGDALVFPGVPEILKAFGRLLTTGRTYLLIWTTLKHLLAALAVATVLGVALGLLQGLSRFFRTLLRPTMILLRSMPMIVLILIVMVVLKYEHVPLVASMLILLPMISEAACEGCLRIDRELIDVYRMNASLNLRVLLQVYLPLMAGYLKQAYINAVGMGVKLAVTTEYLVQTRDSLGKAVYSSMYFYEYQDVYAYALVMILVVLLVSESPVWITKAAACIKNRRQP